MRFLHTSDWHVGRQVRGQSRLAEQEEALQEVLTAATEYAVDCLLVAGDIFDTSAPPPEAESLVYGFFRELGGAGIPAVVVAGNHDHPKRLEAVAPLLDSLGIHVRGRAGPDPVIEILSRAGDERSLIAVLPWVNERDAIDFDTLRAREEAPLLEYMERVGQYIEYMCQSYTRDTVNVLLAHLFVDEAAVGQGGGERELHLNKGIYGIAKTRFDPDVGLAPQYVALGHVHKPQTVLKSPLVAYSGSLLQLDFGEREQQKYVNLVEVHARQPATVTQLPISAGRRLVDVGSPEHGVLLNDLARYRDETADAWARVYVEVDIPVANLAQIVKAELPTAVHVERAHRAAAADAEAVESRAGLGPVEMFSRFYETSLGREREPSPETLALFRTLLSEAEHEPADA